MTKRYQGQIVIYKALHRRPKIGQYEPHLKPVVNACDLEGLAVQAPHVTPVVLLLAVIIQCMEHRFTGFSTNHAVLTRKSKDWLDGMRAMYPSGAICLPADCCFTQYHYKNPTIGLLVYYINVHYPLEMLLVDAMKIYCV